MKHLFLILILLLIVSCSDWVPVGGYNPYDSRPSRRDYDNASRIMGNYRKALKENKKLKHNYSRMSGLYIESEAEIDSLQNIIDNNLNCN